MVSVLVRPLLVSVTVLRHNLMQRMEINPDGQISVIVQRRLPLSLSQVHCANIHTLS